MHTMQKGPCSMLSSVTWGLVLIGAVNWGLVGFGTLISGSNWNLVNLLVGQWPTAEAVVYLLVGSSAVYALATCWGSCSMKK